MEQQRPWWVKSLSDRGTHSPPGSAYALEPDSDRFGLDAPLYEQDLLVDESRMSVRLPFADGNKRDGVGDLIEVAGIELSRHRSNPIALYDHGKAVSLPVGLCQDPESLAYTVNIDEADRKAHADVFFYRGKGMGQVSKDREYDHALFCQQLFDLIAKRFIRGGSIGYTVIAARELPPDYSTGTPKGLHLLATKMLEVSAVVLPANQDTVGKSLSRESYLKGMGETAREILCMGKVCGKSLSPHLVKSLTPYASKSAAGGFLGAMATKSGYKPPRQGGPTEAQVNVSNAWDRGETYGEPHAASEKRAADLAAAEADRKKSDRRQGVKSQGGPAERVRDARENAQREAAAHGGAERVPPERMAKIDSDISAAKAGAREGRRAGQPGSKAIHALKKKYRAVKSVVRRSRRSRPGSATLVVGHKDIPAAKKDAESRGIGFAWVSQLPHGAKVRLTGDDAGIDTLARQYGLPVRHKSLTQPPKEATMNQTDDDSLADGPTDAPAEPYGASILRRIHEDYKLLLADYDRLHGPLEHEPVKKFMGKLMEGKVGHLDEIENLFSKHYKDLPPLAGQDEGEDTDEGDGEDIPEDVDELLDEEGDGEEVMDDDFDEVMDDDGKDMGDLDAAGVGADSGTEREEGEPFPEEAFEAGVKSIRRRIKTKTLSGRAKGHSCKCGGSCTKCKKKKALDVGDYGRGADEGEAEDDAPDDEDFIEREDAENADDVVEEDGDGTEGGLQPHEHEHMASAREFLEQIGKPDSSFSEEDRMKAYHFHKLLDGLAGPIEEMEDPGVPAEEVWSGEPGVKVMYGSRSARKTTNLTPVAQDIVGGVRKVAGAVAGGARKVKDKVDHAAVRAADAVAGGVNKATRAANKVTKLVKPTDLHAGDVLTAGPTIKRKVDTLRGVASHAASSVDTD